MYTDYIWAVGENLIGNVFIKKLTIKWPRRRPCQLWLDRMKNISDIDKSKWLIGQHSAPEWMKKFGRCMQKASITCILHYHYLTCTMKKNLPIENTSKIC